MAGFVDGLVARLNGATDVLYAWQADATHYRPKGVVKSKQSGIQHRMAAMHERFACGTAGDGTWQSPVDDRPLHEQLGAHPRTDER